MGGLALLNDRGCQTMLQFLSHCEKALNATTPTPQSTISVPRTVVDIIRTLNAWSSTAAMTRNQN
jgi:hypothetical protein